MDFIRAYKLGGFLLLFYLATATTTATVSHDTPTTAHTPSEPIITQSARKVYIRLIVYNTNTNTNTNTDTTINTDTNTYTNTGNTKINAGEVVGYTFLLVFFTLAFVTWLCCLHRRHSQRVVDHQQVEILEKGNQLQKKEQGRVEDKQKRVDVEVSIPKNPQPQPRPHNNNNKGVVGQVGKPNNQRPPSPPPPHNKAQDRGQVGRPVKQQPRPPRDKEGIVGQVGRQRGRKKEGKNKEQPQKGVQGDISLVLPKKFSIFQIVIMTNNFDPVNMIGEGGFSRVYKGTLLNGTDVAIKRLKQNHHGRVVDDFRNEIEALGRTSHFNLVKLVGYCFEDHNRLLVYEYMKNGSLDEWIFGSKPGKSLNWEEKMNIILGIAKGLVYLHENCEKKILHRDLKPPNILLDEKLNAKLSDFGISKLLEKDQTSTSTACWGTRGYVAPEVVKGRRISEKVDVYSFGIVVLEIIFGEKYNRMVSSNKKDITVDQLPGMIMNSSHEMWKYGKHIQRIGKLAVFCLQQNPIERPTMSNILSEIKVVHANFRKN